MNIGLLVIVFVFVSSACSTKEQNVNIVRDITQRRASESMDSSESRLVFKLKGQKKVVVKFYRGAVSDLASFFLSIALSPVTFAAGGVVPQTTIEFVANEKDAFYYSVPFSARKHYANVRGTLFLRSVEPWSMNVDSHRFFVNLSNNHFYDGKTSVIGKVIHGMEVLDDIAKLRSRDTSDHPGSWGRFYHHPLLER